MTALSIVIVHYHTPELAADAVAAVRHYTRTGGRAEVIVVDNGSTPEGARVLESLDATVVASTANGGYAAGINLGLAHATGPELIVMNADVMVRPGCIDALRQALREGAAVAGPVFHWDRGGRLLLPPTERRDPASQVLAHMSARGPQWAQQARRRWRRHARRHWTATASLDSVALSGALLAFRRDVWEAVGPFDEGFRLYFEETEWLERIARRGWTAQYVPAARAHHVYNSSARCQPAAATWFDESAREFERRYPQPRVAAWIARLDRRSDTGGNDSVAASSWPAAPDADVPGPGTWIEISPERSGYPAAGQRVESSRWSMPADVWDHLTPGCYTLRLVSDDGHELSARAFRR